MCFGSGSSSSKKYTVDDDNNNTAHEEMMELASNKTSDGSASSNKTYDGNSPSRSLRPKSRKRSSLFSAFSTGPQ